MKTWRAKVLLEGGFQDVWVQANNYLNAKALLESQYGKLHYGPVVERSPPPKEMNEGWNRQVERLSRSSNQSAKRKGGCLAPAVGFLIFVPLMATILNSGHRSNEPSGGSVEPLPTARSQATPESVGQPEHRQAMRAVAALQFSDFPSDPWKGEVIMPNFDEVGLRTYKPLKDDLQKIAIRGPNFGSRYILELVECGPDCSWAILLNLSNGVINTFVSGQQQSNLRLQFQPDSRLVMATWEDISSQQPTCVRAAFEVANDIITELRREIATSPCMDSQPN